MLSRVPPRAEESHHTTHVVMRVAVIPTSPEICKQLYYVWNYIYLNNCNFAWQDIHVSKTPLDYYSYTVNIAESRYTLGCEQHFLNIVNS